MEQDTYLPSLLRDSALSLGIVIDAEQSRKFMIYLDQLKSWNRTTNLTSITNDTEIIVKHFIDSLAVMKAVDFQPGSLVFDVGTGAGFPGIPLKIMRQDLRMVLIEPSKKKASFLRFIVGLLRLEQVDIYEGSLESFEKGFAGKDAASYILARGIKFDFILRLAKTILAMDGKIILFLSTPVDLTRLSGQAECKHEYSFDLPMGHGHRVIATVSLA